MTTATALTGKVKFTNTGTTKYKVETLLYGKRTRWVQHFDSMEKAMEYVEDERTHENMTFLVTEVTTRTLGEF